MNLLWVGETFLLSNVLVDAAAFWHWELVEGLLVLQLQGSAVWGF